MNGRSTRWAAMILVLLAGSLYAWRRAQPPELLTILPQRKNVTLYVPFDGTVRASQTQLIGCPFPASRVKRVLVREGDIIRRGQAVLELDDSLAKSTMARAEANVRAARKRIAETTASQRGPEYSASRQAQVHRWPEPARRDYANHESFLKYSLFRKHLALETLERARSSGSRERIEAARTEVLRASRAITQAEHQRDVVYQSYAGKPFRPQRESALEALEKAEAALRNARKDISDPVVRSNVRGLVSWISTTPGERVRRGDVLASIVNLDNMRVAIRTSLDRRGSGDLNWRAHWNLMSPRYAPYLDTISYEHPYSSAAMPGALVCVNPLASPGTKITGRIEGSWDYDPFHQNWHEIINIRLQGVWEGLRPGMPVKARIVTGYCEEALTIPRSAVTGPTHGPSVLVVREGRVVHQPVMVRGMTPSTAVIIDGLGEGDEVIRYPIEVSPGDRARPMRMTRGPSDGDHGRPN